MGSNLIIKNANFANEAVAHVEPLGTVLQKTVSPYGFAYLASFNPSINWGISKRGSAAEGGTQPSKVIVYDVSSYKGRELILFCQKRKITDDNGVHRSWTAFTSDLGGIQLSDVETLTDSVSGITPVEMIDPSPVSVDDPDNVYPLVVPDNANYLLVNALFFGNWPDIDDIKAVVV